MWDFRTSNVRNSRRVGRIEPEFWRRIPTTGTFDTLMTGRFVNKVGGYNSTIPISHFFPSRFFYPRIKRAARDADEKSVVCCRDCSDDNNWRAWLELLPRGRRAVKRIFFGAFRHRLFSARRIITSLRPSAAISLRNLWRQQNTDCLHKECLLWLGAWKSSYVFLSDVYTRIVYRGYLAIL